MRYTKRICSLLLATVLGISCFADTVSFAATKDKDEIVLSSETGKEETDEEIEISSLSEDDIVLTDTSDNEDIVLTSSDDEIVLKENKDMISDLKSSVSTKTSNVHTREELIFHVSAVNDTEKSSELRLYFLDASFGQVKRADDKSKFLAKSVVDFYLLGVNENYELPVEISLNRGGELDIQESLLTVPNRFAYDKNAPLFGVLELPANSSVDFDMHIWTDKLGDFTILPALIQLEEISYGIPSGVYVEYDEELASLLGVSDEEERSLYAAKAGPYDSRGEIMINFHDYEDPWRDAGGYPTIAEAVMKNQINNGRPFTFQYWFEDFDYFKAGRVPGQGGVRWQNNYYLTPNRQIPKMYQKGIVAPTLSGGYPVLGSTTTAPNWSLAYLFNGQNSNGVIAHYKDVTKLFNKDGNYYSFTDGKEVLTLNPATNEMIHTPGNDMFVPLPVISGLARNFWFGMDISLNFTIPEGRRVDGQDMVYNFYGDDDLWVFVDDVLVLDIGGIHPGLTGSINFTTGEVREGWIYSETERQAHEDSILKTGTRVSSIAQKFQEAGRTWNNAVDTKHSMKIFYLERGNGGSRCGMNFRLPVVSKTKTTSVTASKVWSDNNSASRPTSVTVDLYQNNKVIANAVLNQANGWKHTWSNLVYEKDGQTFTYDVRERAVNGYTGSVQKTGSNESGWKYVFTNTLNMSYVKVQKASANPNITGQSVHYSLAGAEYTIYRDSGCKNKATYTGSLVTNEQGMTGTVAIAPGTYYVKETKPSKGFGLDPKVYTISVTGAHSSAAAALVVNSTEPVRYGTGSLQKVSAKPDITNGNSVYSLEGAEYGVYADKTCKQLIHTLRTDANGNAIWKNVPFGTYYVKETKPSKGFGLDTNIYSFVLTSDNATGVVRSTEPLATGTLSLSKVSALPDETTGNPNYGLAGAEYGVWKTKDCSGTPVHTMRTDDVGIAMLQNVLFGTYYVKETKPSLGFELDKEVHEITLDDGHVDVKVTSTEPLMTGRVRLTKVSDNPNMTDDNSCYSLADAEYGVWKTKECTGEPYRKVVTGEDGTFVLEQLPFGNYWVKEIKPSKGFDLDTNVYPVVLDGAHMEAVVNSVEPSQNDPMVISITKLHEGDETDTIPSLAGTQFTVWYYDNLTKDVSGIPKKTWVLEVKQRPNGKWVCALQDEYLVKEKSDDFYRSPNTKKPVLPYGTYKIQETKHAPGYTFNGGFTNADGTVSLSAKDPYITVVDKNTTGGANLVGGNEYSATNKTVPMSITLKKFGDGKQPLAGVTFKIQSKSGYAETQPDFQSELTTGPDGTVKWSKLHPDVYTITEIKTVDGYSLLQDPIEVQLPSSFTKEQAQNSNLVDPNPDDDTDGVIWNELEQVYLVTDPVFEIDNHVTFVAPSTGGTFTWMMLFPLGLGLVGFGLLIGYVWKRKRV